MTSKKTASKKKVFSDATRPTYEGQKFNQPHLTIPDQTMSLRELIDRYQRGLPLPDAGEPIYLNENGIAVDFDKLSKTEKQEFLIQAADELKELSEKMEKVNAAKMLEQENLRIKEIEDRIRQEITAKEGKKPKPAEPTEADF